MADEHTIDEYMRDRRNLPWEWADTICACDIPGYEGPEKFQKERVTNERYYRGTARYCTKCHKRYRWQFLKCRECNDLYDYLFWHHALDREQNGWARNKSLCWNHICEEDPANETDIPPLILTVPRKARSLSEILSEEISFDF